MARYDELMAAVCQDDADRTTYGPLVEKAVLLDASLRMTPMFRRHQCSG